MPNSHSAAALVAIDPSLEGGARDHQDPPLEAASANSRSRTSALIIIFAILLASADNFADPDLWMHLLLGKAILSTGHIPWHDTYSYTVAGIAARNHEWLAETIFAFAYGWGGAVSLKLVKLACASVTITALAAGLAQTTASERIQRTILIVAAGALTTQMQFRPQIFTFAMLSMVMAMLATEIYRGRARLWPLLPMFALWANLHGGFTVGIGALGLAAVVLSAQELVAGATPRRGLRLGGVTLLAACATIANPSGIGMWTNVLHSVSDPLIRIIVIDWITLPKMVLFLWHSSKMGLLQILLPIGLFAAFGYSMVAAPTLEDAPLTAVALVFMGASFYMVRNLALGVIAVAIPLASHVANALAKRPSHSEASDSLAKVPLSPKLIGAAAALVAIAGGMFSSRLPTWQPVPVGAMAFMQERKLGGNILNLFEWGGYIIWHQPQDRVFVDTRTELVYPDVVMREYAEFFYAKPGARRALDEHPPDLALLKAGTGAVGVLQSDRNWKVIYRDPVAVLFAPASSKIPPASETSTLASSTTSFP